MRRAFLSILLLGLCVAAGCGGGGSSSSSTTTTTPGGSGGSGSNVLAIAVNGGPAVNLPNGFIYQNAAFASATICAPGSTSNCVTIDNLLVDTGSTGLRVFDTEVSSLNLPAVNASNGSAAYDCVSFVDNSFLWGPVQKADVKLGSETASGVPIHVISTSNSPVPSSCSSSGNNDNSLDALGANGILGVGSEPTDCVYADASACDPSAGGNPPFPAYYTCSGSTCNPAFIARANQVANPVVLLPTDNNGVIVELPSASGNEATMSGSLIFGIGTESNNQLPSSATVFTLAPCIEFTTVFDGQTFAPGNCTNSSPGSFIDSGSSGLYFPDVGNSINVCSTDPNSEFYDLYCPPSTQSFSATNQGENGASKSTSFSVGNAEDILNNPATGADAVLPTLDGLQPQGYGFDWGLPFFYGVNVYTSIDGQKMPSGAPAAPWWAY